MNRLFARRIRNISVLLAIFGMAMGFLEAMTVVYMRQKYFPQGFAFPLGPLPPHTLVLESLREMTTIVMLAIIAMLGSKNSLRRFVYFAYIFGIWDLSYYGALKLLLNWPPSLLTWDVLFLIPVPWVAPVLAPMICSFIMMAIAGWIFLLQEKGYRVKLGGLECGLILLGVLMILWTFASDCCRIFVRECYQMKSCTLPRTDHFLEIFGRHKPIYYNWPLFALSQMLILGALAMDTLRTKQTRVRKQCRGAGHRGYGGRPNPEGGGSGKT
jgi:hypothetical protein